MFKVGGDSDVVKFLKRADFIVKLVKSGAFESLDKDDAVKIQNEVDQLKESLDTIDPNIKFITPSNEEITFDCFGTQKYACVEDSVVTVSRSGFKQLIEEDIPSYVVVALELFQLAQIPNRYSLGIENRGSHKKI